MKMKVKMCAYVYGVYRVDKTRADLAVPILTGEHERRGTLVHLRLEISASLDQVQGNLLEMGRCN